MSICDSIKIERKKSLNHKNDHFHHFLIHNFPPSYFTKTTLPNEHMNKAQGSSANQTIQSAAHHISARRQGRVDAQMVQNVLLIWLDSTIDEKSPDCQNTIRHLRRTVHTIHTFIDGEECIQFLKDIANEKVCMIISGALGQTIVSRVHNLSQVDSIFIFCEHRVYHEELARNWSKVKGVFTEITLICKALQQAAQQCEQNAIPFSIMPRSGGDMQMAGNQLDPSFMYTQIMKEIFLTITFEQNHFDEFIEYCRETLGNNETQLKYVHELARGYRRRTPIWWYTCESFLYPMLNRALRTINVDVIIKMGFFIVALHRHIEQLHREQFGGGSFRQHLTVYRGQGMDKEAYRKMVANQGGLISFNTFLSTSKHPSVSHLFATNALADPQLMGILFVMTIDPARCNTPFASVTEVGCYGKQEHEVLFSMHTVFRIGEITPMVSNPRLVKVQLNLASDNDNDLRQLIDHIRKQTFPDASGWYRLGSLLCKMREFIKAQQVYEKLLRKETKETDKAPIYHQLGVMKQEQAKYAEAIAYYEQSIQIEENQIPRRDQNLAMSYNNLGSVYYQCKDYIKALLSHEKALVIRQQSLPPAHPLLASSYNNIGTVCDCIGDYPKALLSHEKALAIRRKSLPSTHPDLATSYNNIGNLYKNMGDYPTALSFYKKDLKISKKSLLPTDPSLAKTYANIGSLHENMGNDSEALGNFQRALDIAQHSLPADHPELQRHRENFARIKKKL